MPGPPDVRERLVPRRRKIALACEPCRERKSRCDGTKPLCASCQRRGIPMEQCLYTVDNARTASNDAYLKVLHDRIRVLEQMCLSNGIEVPPIGARPDDSGAGREHPPAALPLAAPPMTATVATGPVNENLNELAALPIRQEVLPILSKEESNVANSTHNVSGMGTISADADSQEVLAETERFYGTSSAASFMKEAYQSMGTTANLDPEDLTPSSSRTTSENKCPHQSLRPPLRFQTIAATHVPTDAYLLPTRAFADDMLARFWERVYPLYPFFHRPSFENAYANLWNKTDDPAFAARHAGLGLGVNPAAGAGTLVFQASLNFVLALGCHFADLSPQERMATAASFIHRAKACVHPTMMEVADLGVVHCLLLMTVISQATPYPNRCWAALGVGCRIAQSFGAYTESSRTVKSALQPEIQRRTWHCLVMLDQLVGMTYGRPAMTPYIVELPLPSQYEGEDTLIPESRTTTMVSFFSEYIRLSSLLGEISSKVYKSSRSGSQVTSSDRKLQAGLDVIVDLEAKLALFEHSVPLALSWRTPTRFDKTALEAKRRMVLEEQSTVLHGRFLYVRLMLHRPVLSQFYHTSTAVHKSADDEVGSHATIHEAYGSFAEGSAQTCLRTAMDILDLVHDTYLTEKTGGWWWDGFYACTAGLVLIVGQLCPALVDGQSSDRMEHSWRVCQGILQHFASFCPPVEKTLKLLQRMHSEIAVRNGGPAPAQQPDKFEQGMDAAQFDSTSDPFTQNAFEQYNLHPDSWMIGHGPPVMEMQQDWGVEWNPAFDIGFITDDFGFDVMNW